MAYTKYSLTPANNTAAPPDGAPEGMLPSAVNDTMRDMMAQIRDCGDGIRDGTYTMTAPKITGGTITGATVTSNTFSSSGATITGGTINGTTIGATTASTGKFTAVTNSALTSGRVTYAGASGLLSDSSDFVWDNSNTRLGIGISSPAAAIDVLGSYLNGGSSRTNTNTKTFGFRVPHCFTATNPMNVIGGLSTTSVNYVYIGGSDSNIGGTAATNLFFYTAANNTTADGTLRMSIDSSGNLLVGTTTQRARITAETTNDECIFAINSAGAASATMCSWNNAGTGDNYFHAFFVDAGGANVGNIDYNRAGGLVRYQTTSDATLKNIIGDSNGQRSLEILNTTRIREFAWKNDPTQKPQIGVIAQELHETYKGAVSVGGDIEKTDEEGNVTTEYRPWGVDKTAFTFHLIAGWQAHEKLIQELNAKLDAQAAEIALLKSK